MGWPHHIEIHNHIDPKTHFTRENTRDLGWLLRRAFSLEKDRGSWGGRASSHKTQNAFHLRKHGESGAVDAPHFFALENTKNRIAVGSMLFQFTVKMNARRVLCGIHNESSWSVAGV